jgi:hypothetical protein
VTPALCRVGPLLAIEVLSTRNTPANIKRKLTLYLSKGGGEVWVVDGKRKSMSVYRKTEGQVVRVAADSSYTSDSASLSSCPNVRVPSSHDLLSLATLGTQACRAARIHPMSEKR